MNTVIEKMLGMDKLNDQMIASDLLNGAKNAIKCYTTALTESATPVLREEYKKQLNQAIDAHYQILTYMESKGWYKPYELREQIQMDLRSSEQVNNMRV